MLLRVLLLWLFVCSGFGTLLLSMDARADAVLILFRPPAQGTVAGYKVYAALSTSGPISSAPVDAGARYPDGSGIASYSLSGLDPTKSYDVEMTTYDASGTESRRSNRLTVGPRSETLGAPLWSNDFSAFAPTVHVPGFLDSLGDTRTTTGTDLFKVRYDTGNNPAYGTAAAAGAVASLYTGSNSSGWGSYEISGRVWAGGVGVRAGIAARVSNSDGSRYFELAQSDGGAWGVRGRDEYALKCRNTNMLGVTQPAARWYSFKYRVTQISGKTRLRAKLWPFGGSEPSWQVDCWNTLANPTQDTGVFALRRGGAGGAYWDDLSVRPVQGTLEPIPPQ
jgi:hypothetical protein